MECFINRTGSFLPGPAIGNHQIQDYLGMLEGEQDVMQRVLKANGITQRHYAIDGEGGWTHNVYQLGAFAAQSALRGSELAKDVSYLSVGTTFSPMSAPGAASLIHSQLADLNLIKRNVEVSSHAGVCTSSAAALIGAVRAIKTDHRSALAIGCEHSSAVLAANRISPIDDRDQHENIRESQWFMSVFLRFMLSDGAGAFLLSQNPNPTGISFRVNWTHSISFANETPLCMKLDNDNQLLSQDVRVLAKHLIPCADRATATAMRFNDDCLSTYDVILPHLSSYFFERRMRKVIQKNCGDFAERVPPFWTNLATVGNTGSASIYLILDEYARAASIEDGKRILLFIPESGQFNFVFVSLTAVFA